MGEEDIGRGLERKGKEREPRSDKDAGGETGDDERMKQEEDETER